MYIWRIALTTRWKWNEGHVFVRPILHAPIRPLNHGGKYKYHSMNIQNDMHPATQCVDVSHIPLRINKYHFHIQNQQNGSYNEQCVCYEVETRVQTFATRNLCFKVFKSDNGFPNIFQTDFTKCNCSTVTFCLLL